MVRLLTTFARGSGGVTKPRSWSSPRVLNITSICYARVHTGGVLSKARKKNCSGESLLASTTLK